MPIPALIWPPARPTETSTPPRPEVNETAGASKPEVRDEPLLAIGNTIPLVYGRTQLGARIATVITQGAELLLLCVVGHGPVAAIEAVQADGGALPAGSSVTKYLGAPGQAADPRLTAAFAAQGIIYADTLPGIAYYVINIPSGESNALPRLTATVQGRLLYDPRLNVISYSDNPALALADLASNTLYGAGLAVDWASVSHVADHCDALVGTAPNQEKRRTIGLALVDRVAAGALFSALRVYAGCFIDRSGSTVRLIPDAPAGPVMSFYDADIVEGSLRLKKRGLADVPTVLRVSYSNADHQFATDEVEAVLPGVIDGSLDRRESTVDLPGITRYSQAMREATERLNKLWLQDLEIAFGTFDAGLALQVGAVVTVRHGIGLTAKQFRVARVDAKEAGRWEIAGVEYDAATYVDSVQTAPSTPDTQLPNPLAPPAVTGLLLTEEVFQQRNGQWASRLCATWSAPAWPYLAGYRAELWDGAALLESSSTTVPLWRSGAVVEGALLTVRVCALSTLAAGAWANASITPIGKYLLPSNVPSVTGFEVGGEVRLSIAAATDLDMVGYEVRYGPVGCTWALSGTVKFVDFVNAASGVGGYVVYKDAPQGTWDFLVCARDSIGQYSPIPARVTITVTLDVNAFLVDNHDFSAGTPTLAGMAEYSLPCDPARYFVTEDNALAASKFPAVASTYGAFAATYHASLASTFLSPGWDFGQSLAGNWSGSLSCAALSGSKTDCLALSGDGASYTDQSGLTAKAVARFGRIKSSAAGTATLKVTMPEARLRVDAIPRVENGMVTTSASGYVTVNLANAYSAVKSIVLTPVGSAPIHAVVDAVVVGASASFRIYAFNSTTNAQVAVPVMWAFEGV